MKIDDETLCAYLDDELADEQAQRVDQLLQDDAQLAARLGQLRAGKQRFGALQTATLPPPSASLNRVLMAPANLPVRRRVDWRAWWSSHGVLGPALSVGVVAMIGIAIGLGLRTEQAPGLAPWMGLVMEHAQSGTSHRQDELELVLLESYQAPDGRYCRRYLLSDSATSNTRWACRSPSEGWTARPPQSEAAAPADSPDTYRLASGDAKTPELERLTPTQEAQLLANQWQAPTGDAPR